MVVLSINLITADPSVRGGRPVIAGTSIRVADIVAAKLFHNRTPDDLALDYGLTLAQVYAALAYYYEHKAEIDHDVRQNSARVTAAKEKRLGSRRALLP